VKKFTVVEAIQIGERVGIELSKVDPEQFCLGMSVEHEHGSHDALTNVTNDDPLSVL
jgi:hypothetical protein